MLGHFRRNCSAVLSPMTPVPMTATGFVSALDENTFWLTRGLVAALTRSGLVLRTGTPSLLSFPWRGL
jgi:hypothetical protein